MNFVGLSQFKHLKRLSEVFSSFPIDLVDLLPCSCYFETIPLSLEPTFLLGGFLWLGYVSGKELIRRVVITDVPKVLSVKRRRDYV